MFPRALVIVIASHVFGCAAFNPSLTGTDCNFDQAYARGMNDGSRGRQMFSEWVGKSCAPETQADVQTGYREGYIAGRDSRPAPVVVVADRRGPAYVVAQPECIEAYGRKACGYDCVEAYGQIMCGQHPGDNCVESYGRIRCGLGCRAEYGTIKCGDER